MAKIKTGLNICVVLSLVVLLIYSMFFRDNVLWYDYNLEFTSEWSQLMDNIIYLSLAISMFVLSLILFIVLLVIKYKDKRASAFSPIPIFNLGIVTLDLGVWIVTLPALTSILSHAYIFFRMINLIAFMYMPLSLLNLLRSLSNKEYILLEIITQLSKIFFILKAAIFMSGTIRLSTGLYLLQSLNVLTLIVFVTYILVRKQDFGFGKITTTLIIIALPLSITSLITFFFINNWIIFTILSVIIILIPSFINIVTKIYTIIQEATINLKYKEFALTDIMTGLGSRFAYENLIEKYSTNVPNNLTLIFMDVDGLKTANDTLGHKAGDEIIIATAECIKAVFKGKTNAECFRMGGDEFLVSMTEPKSTVENCIEEFNKLVNKWSGELVKSLSVSCGYVTASDDKNLSIDDMIHKADEDMYNTKKEHKKLLAQKAAEKNISKRKLKKELKPNKNEEVKKDIKKEKNQEKKTSSKPLNQKGQKSLTKTNTKSNIKTSPTNKVSKSKTTKSKSLTKNSPKPISKTSQKTTSKLISNSLPKRVNKKQSPAT